jgi:LuxR family transcriptional regulator, maltose regulon positive regulatory protein
MRSATAATARTGATNVALAAEPTSRRPSFRPGLVPRERLVARLGAAGDVPLVLVVAPAGYGKTTALAEWAEQDDRAFAWIGLQPEDGEPARLLRSIALALDEIEPVGREVFIRSAQRGEGPDMLTQRLARSLAARRRPFVLVLDDAHVIRSPAAFAALEVLIDHMPAGSHLALASRSEPAALPIGRLRTHRRLAELRTRDLAMTSAEASALLSGLGLRSADIDMLVDRTEGWPAGLYLAALSLREQPDRGRALARFAGDDRFVAEYVRDELLAELPGDRLRFLRRTSVLEDLSGPLCDAVLARPGSGGTLRDLARSNLMLVPLDRADDRYRYHGLFAEMLRGELRRLEPEYEREAHRRASAWHATRGDVERAIHHAIAADDVRGAAELLWHVAPEYVMSNRHAAVRGWLERFTNEQVAGEPRLALAAATSAFAAGDRDRVEHWCAAAERGLRADADRSPRRGGEAAIAVLRAFVGHEGPAAMAADAAAVDGRVDDDMPWRGICCLIHGVAAHLAGDAGDARAHLEDGARRAAVAAPVVQVLCLAQLGVAALDEGDADTAEVSIARARQQIERLTLREHPLCALVLAASALDCAQRGRVDEARRDLSDGSRLLAVLTDVAPWYDAETRLLLARAALRLGDVVGARTLLAEASRIVPRAAAPALDAWLEEAWARADSFAVAAILGPSSLTTAELRVLRLLPTHLSFREIASSLHVSANTVKTHAHAVYRKLDASSRTEAVTNARQVGLLDA